MQDHINKAQINNHSMITHHYPPISPADHQGLITHGWWSFWPVGRSLFIFYLIRFLYGRLALVSIQWMDCVVVGVFSVSWTEMTLRMATGKVSKYNRVNWANFNVRIWDENFGEITLFILNPHSLHSLSSVLGGVFKLLNLLSASALETLQFC